MRVLLDTNIWSRLADQRQQDSFVRLVRSMDLTVVVPPATLLEILRTPLRTARRTRVRLVCRMTWHRLKTEAESEADELVQEIRRLHPEWLLAKPDLERITGLERFWLNDIWEGARRENPTILENAHRQGAAERAAVLNSQRQQQAQWREEGALRSLEELRHGIRFLRAAPQSDPISIRRAEEFGWEAGRSVEPWRYKVQVAYWHTLTVAPQRAQHTGEDTTDADWVGSYVSLDAIRSNKKEFGRMLLYEVEDARMPRAWLRWAVDFAQHSVRIGAGNPVDGQLAPYLAEADLFATNDRRLARIVEAIRPSSPGPCATGAFVDIKGAGGSVLDAFREATRTCIRE
jgi:predicted nucleic acid-binding protein